MHSALDRPVSRSPSGVVSGNLRILTGKSQEEASIGLYWKYESWIRSNLSRCDSLLGATGPIYAFRRELACPLPADSLLDDVWLPMQAVLRGFVRCGRKAPLPGMSLPRSKPNSTARSAPRPASIKFCARNPGF